METHNCILQNGEMAVFKANNMICHRLLLAVKKLCRYYFSKLFLSLACPLKCTVPLSGLMKKVNLQRRVNVEISQSGRWSH